ncbi:MAG: putative Ig domain-containing protein [Candidatus Polarisedimenticolaceae bacterium]|nr:putative Ig domain-containing protein [Candidatus Polarisedimenticolaceae bacterium]
MKLSNPSAFAKKITDLSVHSVAEWLSIILLVIASIYGGLAQADIDTSRTKAVAWLLQNQRGDGSWNAESVARIQATNTALHALDNAGIGGFPLARGLSWISNAEAESVDSLAHQAMALNLAGIDAQVQRDKLISWRNVFNSWGAYDHYNTSFPDAALASSVLRSDPATYQAQKSKLLYGLCQILVSQKTGDPTVNGSWSYISPLNPELLTSGNSFILPTVYNILEIAAFKELGYNTRYCSGTTYTFDTVLNSAVDWLINQRKHVDNGFGDGNQSRAFDTALAYLAIQAVRPADPSLSAAQNYLLSTQGTGGDWQGDVLATAMVLRTFPQASPVDGDLDGISDIVELVLGTNPAVRDGRTLGGGNGNGTFGINKAYVFHTIANTAFSGILSVTGGQEPYTWALVGNLPDGLAINTGTGEISGTPISFGSYNFTYYVTDSTGNSINAVGQIVVDTEPVLNSTIAQTSDEGVSISLPQSASDADGDALTFSASGLPTGLSIHPVTGLITGFLNYDAVGIYNTVVTITDGKQDVSSSFSWTVNDVDRVPVITNPLVNQTNQEGSTVNIQVNAYDPDGGTITFDATGLPLGLAISPGGLISGTLSFDALRTYNVTIIANDGNHSSNNNFIWTIGNVNRAPEMDAIGVYSVTEGESLAINLAANDPDGEAISFAVEFAIEPPPGMVTLTDNGNGTGRLDINPGFSDAYTYGIDVKAIDNNPVSPMQVIRDLVINIMPDVTEVVRLQTPWGAIDIELYGNVAPLAVSNFLNYINDGDYTSSIIHHVNPGAYIAGGVIKFDNGLLVNVPQDAPIANEFKLSNRPHTVAMTHPANDINGATSEWVINLADNSSAFDPQKYTVFGRVIGGMEFASAISNLRTEKTFGPVFDVPLVDVGTSSYLVPITQAIKKSFTVRSQIYKSITNAPFNVALPKPIGGVEPYDYVITQGSLPDGLILNPSTGEITGIPTNSGVYVFTYTVTDSLSDTESAPVQIQANALPIFINPGSQNNEEGERVEWQINASGAESGETFTYAAWDLPPGLTIDAQTGLISGTIGAATAGVYVAKVAVFDGTWGNLQTFTWTVQSANGLVVDSIRDYTIAEGQDVLNVPINASGVAADLCILPTAMPPFATLIDNGNGTGTIQLAPGYQDAGSYAVTITLGDKASLCDAVASPLFPPRVLNFNIEVTDVNQLPVITKPDPQASVTGESPTLQIGAVDPESAQLLYDAINLPLGLSINLYSGLISGTISYEASGDYSVLIGVLDTATAKIATTTFIWAVTGDNLPPTANADDASLNEDTDLIINVLENDVDANGDALSLSGITLIAVHGTLDINPDNTITYTPDADFNGSDTFVYTVADESGLQDSATVTITVNAVNDPPVVTNPGEQINAENANINLPIVVNDIDSATFSYLTTDLPSGLSINPVTGVITGILGYETAGVHSSTVTVHDGIDNTDISVVWTVSNTNRVPNVSNPGNQLNAEGDVVISLQIIASDSDGGDTLGYSAAGLPTGLIINPITGKISGTLGYASAGMHNVTVTVSDGSASIDIALSWTVSDTNQLPAADADTVAVNENDGVADITATLLAGDIDPDSGDSLSISTIDTIGTLGSATLNMGVVSYDPNSQFEYLADGATATDSFSYTVTDNNGGLDSAIVTILVTGVNDIPTAVDDVDTTLEDTSVTVTVLGNDSDIDGDTLSISGVSQGANGSVTTDGTIVTYTPNVDHIGLDHFTYTVSDGNLGSATATVTVTTKDASATLYDIVYDPAISAKGVVPSVPVTQNIGIPDTAFDLTSNESCWQCHASQVIQAGLTQPFEVPDQTVFLANRHHQFIGTSIAGGSELPPYLDADNDGINDENYSCLSCHAQTEDVNGDLVLTQDYQDCLFCHVADGAVITVHHDTPKAREALCAECHGSLVRNLDEGLPPPADMPGIITPRGSNKLNADTSTINSAGTHPGNCDFCHNTQDGQSAGTLMPSILGEITVFPNLNNHHSTGVHEIEGSSKGSPCQWCHIVEWPAWYEGDPAADKAPWQMRACQRCHDASSLHAIEVDIAGDGIVPGAEAYNSGHIGNQDNCWGCHGNDSDMIPVYTGGMPVVTATTPQLDGISAVTWKWGTEFVLDLKGNGFINQGEAYDPLTGNTTQTTFMPKVQLTDDDGNTTMLDPLTPAADFISVAIPWLIDGNYQVQVKKGDRLSNPIAATITPGMIFAHALCLEKYRIIFLRGTNFGMHLRGSNTGTRITTGDGVDANVVYFWKDHMIAAVFYGGCPSEVVVTNVFDSVTLTPVVW